MDWICALLVIRIFMMCHQFRSHHIGDKQLHKQSTHRFRSIIAEFLAAQTSQPRKIFRVLQSAKRNYKSGRRLQEAVQGKKRCLWLAKLKQNLRGKNVDNAGISSMQFLSGKRNVDSSNTLLISQSNNIIITHIKLLI